MYGLDLSQGSVGIVIAPEIDMHAFAVRNAGAEVGRSIVVIDTADFTRNFDLIARWNGGSKSGSLLLKDSRVIELSQVSGLWWRRPREPDVSDTVSPAFSEVAKKESREALWGSLNSILPGAFNALGSSREANQKPVQLGKAVECGLKIPDTLISNNQEAILEFYNFHRRSIIYKIFKGPEMGFYPTRTLSEDDLIELSSIRNSPCIFQENIIGQFDIRVTVVGGELFSAKIEYDSSSGQVDSRATATSCVPYTLPNHINEKLLALVQGFGLVFCAIDLRKTLDGDYVFFELNPEGQYLWTEIEAGLPISQSIARYLTTI